MWIFTRYGFFSLAQRPEMDAEHPVQVRARCREDLRSLQAHFGALLGSRPIIDTPRGDYPARICVTSTTFDDLMREIARDLDYGNFKSMIGQTPDQEDKRNAYHEIWGIMANYQREKTGKGPYGGR